MGRKSPRSKRPGSGHGVQIGAVTGVEAVAEYMGDLVERKARESTSPDDILYCYCDGWGHPTIAVLADGREVPLDDLPDQ